MKNLTKKQKATISVVLFVCLLVSLLAWLVSNRNEKRPTYRIGEHAKIKTGVLKRSDGTPVR